MKLRILTSALNDLADGRAFYESQGAGLGDYFFDSVFADIDALALYGGIHPKVMQSATELYELKQIVEERQDEIRRNWRRHFKS
jgi:hypothetical protein